MPDRTNDLAGRIIGMIVFIGGIAVLVFVFLMALDFFTTAEIGIVPTPTAGPDQPAATDLGSLTIRLIVQIGLLVVMTIIGSLIAGRGIQLYFAALGERRVRTPRAEPE